MDSFKTASVSGHAVTPQLRRSTRNNMISSGLQLTRVAAALRRASRREASADDLRLIETLREDLDSASFALREGTEALRARPDLRSMASVRVAIDVAATPHSGEVNEIAAAQTLQQHVEVLDLLMKDASPDTKALQAFVDELISFASRTTGGSGEVLRSRR